MTVDLNTSLDARARGWGSGWPNCQTSEIVPLEVELQGHKVVLRAHTITPEGLHVATLDLPGGVRGEIHELTTMLLEETASRGYKLIDGWCWGFACRAIRGSLTVASNHSWGLAVDLNAPTNPLTDDGITHTDMPAWMPDLWNEFGFRWGGDYRGSSRRDAMHYEFMGTPADAAALTVIARERGLGIVLTAQQTKDLARLEGFNARLDQAPQPKKDGPQKRGWNDADELVKGEAK